MISVFLKNYYSKDICLLQVPINILHLYIYPRGILNLMMMMMMMMYIYIYHTSVT